jgi:hypothetical protein
LKTTRCEKQATRQFTCHKEIKMIKYLTHTF